jgi:3-keto-L-gulonate-6-phosphate decarboxylase
MALPKCVRDESESNIKPFKKKVSTAFAVGDIVIVDSSGFIDQVAAASAAAVIVGVCMQPVLSTDADYAVATPIAIDVFRKNNNGDTFRLQVETGTPAQTMVGETHDLTSAGKAELTATSTNVYKVQRILSATEVLVTFVE